jgi:hypothetical protein
MCAREQAKYDNVSQRPCEAKIASLLQRRIQVPTWSHNLISAKGYPHPPSLEVASMVCQ